MWKSFALSMKASSLFKEYMTKESPAINDRETLDIIMIDYLEKAAIWICRGLAVIAGSALTLMILLACANMVSRAVWIPVKGTFELMGFLGAVTAGFSLWIFAAVPQSYCSGAFVQAFSRSCAGCAGRIVQCCLLRVFCFLCQ